MVRVMAPGFKPSLGVFLENWVGEPLNILLGQLVIHGYPSDSQLAMLGATPVGWAPSSWSPSLRQYRQ